LAKLRWRIERDYQELKQELGLGHFEGRGWHGFHHHATLCIAAYGFLISERETISSWCQAQTINVAARHRTRDGGYVHQYESGGGLWTDANSVRTGRFEGSSPSGAVHRATTLYSVDPLGPCASAA